MNFEGEKKEYFQDSVELWTPDGLKLIGSLLIYLGDISTLDGLIVNSILERLPLIKETDVRHRIIVSPTCEDGRPIKTVVGTKNKTIKIATKMLSERFNVVKDPQLP